MIEFIKKHKLTIGLGIAGGLIAAAMYPPIHPASSIAGSTAIHPCPPSCSNSGRILRR